MVHLTILLSICFIVQTLGYVLLKRNILSKTDNLDIGELKRVVRKSAGYIVLGLVIQLIVIVSQIFVYLLFVRNLD